MLRNPLPAWVWVFSGFSHQITENLRFSRWTHSKFHNGSRLVGTLTCWILQYAVTLIDAAVSSVKMIDSRGRKTTMDQFPLGNTAVLSIVRTC
jgi:hypothetical protein